MNAIKILIVENELIVSEQMAAYLQQLEYNVCGIAEKGEEALELIKNDIPDIVLMDIDLDGELDGVDTAALIQEDIIIPIIYLTNFDDDRTLNRVKQTMPAAYLIKPFRNLDLRNAIEMAIYNAAHMTLNKSERDINVTIEMSFEKEKEKLEELYILNDRLFYKRFAGQYNRLVISEIVYLESDSNNTIAYTISGVFTLPFNLKHTLKKLEGTPLLRIHRQYAINIDYIVQINGFDITLEFMNSVNKNGDIVNPAIKEEKTLPVSSSKKDGLFKKLKIRVEG